MKKLFRFILALAAIIGGIAGIIYLWGKFMKKDDDEISDEDFDDSFDEDDEDDGYVVFEKDDAKA